MEELIKLINSLGLEIRVTEPATKAVRILSKEHHYYVVTWKKGSTVVEWYRGARINTALEYLTGNL